MSLERAAMKGELVDMRLQAERLRNRIKGITEVVRLKLNTTRIQPDDLEIPVVDEQMDQLKEAWSELLTIKTKIAAYERELN
jgi:vacuolar-type H+-ATPase subunit D/Vma8